ncbi:MAG: hypothetical protein ACR2HV_01085 [Acidimicrobiales bacterium]
MTDISVGTNYSSWAVSNWIGDEIVMQSGEYSHRLLGLALNGHGPIYVSGPARLVATASLSFRLRTPTNGPTTRVWAWLQAGKQPSAGETGEPYQPMSLGFAATSFGQKPNDIGR